MLGSDVMFLKGYNSYDKAGADRELVEKMISLLQFSWNLAHT